MFSISQINNCIKVFSEPQNIKHTSDAFIKFLLFPGKGQRSEGHWPLHHLCDIFKYIISIGCWSIVVLTYQSVKNPAS